MVTPWAELVPAMVPSTSDDALHITQNDSNFKLLYTKFLNKTINSNSIHFLIKYFHHGSRRSCPRTFIYTRTDRHSPHFFSPQQHLHLSHRNDNNLTLPQRLHIPRRRLSGLARNLRFLLDHRRNIRSNLLRWSLPSLLANPPTIHLHHPRHRLDIRRQCVPEFISGRADWTAF